jgi:hypothetical protein
MYRVGVILPPIQVLAPTSRVRPNQRGVAEALYKHAQAAWRGRPGQQQLGVLLETEYKAAAQLRKGLLAALEATYTLVRHWLSKLLVTHSFLTDAAPAKCNQPSAHMYVAMRLNLYDSSRCVRAS